MRNWNQYRNQIREAVEATFEQITFSLVQEVNDPIESHRLPMVETFISCTISDIERVALSLSMQERFLETLVSDLYPHAQSGSDLYMQDTIDELANTIAGIFFRLIEEEVGNFKLSIPYHERPTNWSTSTNFNFLLDDTHPLVVSFCH